MSSLVLENMTLDLDFLRKMLPSIQSMTLLGCKLRGRYLKKEHANVKQLHIEAPKQKKSIFLIKSFQSLVCLLLHVPFDEIELKSIIEVLPHTIKYLSLTSPCCFGHILSILKRLSGC